MTGDDDIPAPGGGRMATDQQPQDAEEFAEQAGIDPTPQEVQEYEAKLEAEAPSPPDSGDDPGTPGTEPS